MKKLIAVVLALVMVMTFAACNNTTDPKGTDKGNEATTTTPTTEGVELCICGCGKPASEITWVDPMTWLQKSGALTATSIHCYAREDVHLKLNADFSMTEAFQVPKQLHIGQKKKDYVAYVAIDLNGFTWHTDWRTYIDTDSTLTILDTSAAQTGKMTSTGHEDLAGRNICNLGTFNLRGGTLTMPEGNLAFVPKGGIVYQSNGVFNMYGGVIENGVADSDGLGGNVYINDGDFNMYGGIIRNGKGAQGYNVWLEVGTVFTQEGGEIVADSADPDNSVYQNG